MMTGAAVSEAWEELLNCGGRLASSKSNALAPWRFEPWSMMMPENNCADAALTLALQKQLCSNKSVNDVSSNGFVAVSAVESVPVSGSDWKCKAESEVSSGSETDGGRNFACGGVKGFEFESPPQREEGGRSVTASKSGGPLCVNGSGKVSKRRSRAASKSPITFLNADPANFRAMVQQVTGVPLNPNATRLWGPGGGGISMPALLKPEPKRPSASSSGGGGGGGGPHVIQGLPTLDTSALFINSARLASATTRAADFATFAPPPLVRSAAARPPPPENELFTEKLRAACMQSFMKNGGGDGGSGGFVAEQASQGMNLAHEADSWLNNNGFPDNMFADFNGSASFGASLPV